MTKDQILTRLSTFQHEIGYSFKQPDLLVQVFVHRSYLNEHKAFVIEHNERLEFLGDAVLELVVTEYLYRTYDNAEGELTNWRSALVKGDTLSKVAQEIQMEEYLLLSKGETRGTGKARRLILANALEALVGAIYLDGGYSGAKNFVVGFLISKLEVILKMGLDRDPKSSLQEYIQEKRGETPTYRVIRESGPDHNKEFIIGVFVGQELLGKGEGASKNRAQQAAAHNALEKMSYPQRSTSGKWA